MRRAHNGAVIRVRRLVGRALVSAAITIALASGSGSASADDTPFRVPAQNLARIDQLAADAVRGKAAPLERALERDPFFKALLPDLKLDRALADAAKGRFDKVAFDRRANRAIAKLMRDVGSAALMKKLVVYSTAEAESILRSKTHSLATYLDQSQKNKTATPKKAPVQAKAVGRIFGRESTTLRMAPARGAYLERGGRGAINNYGWVLSSRADAPGRASARVETGRAVYLGGSNRSAVDTEVLLKGIGPTPYAGNVFNSRDSGSFFLHEGAADWDNTLLLEKAGIPVYKPVALIGLPYWQYSKARGYVPLGLYARLPQENLRVSDLGVLSHAKRRDVASQLREKIAKLSGNQTVTNEDVIMFFAERMGRISGLFEGGKTLGGKRYFHGMLHLQNVSLLGEIVDLGTNVGLVGSRAGLEKAYKSSGYKIKERNWPSEILAGASEKSVFRYLATAFFEDLSVALPKKERPPKEAVLAAFERGYRDGHAGKRAHNARTLLTAARRSTTKRNATTRTRQALRQAQQQQRRSQPSPGANARRRGRAQVSAARRTAAPRRGRR